MGGLPGMPWAFPWPFDRTYMQLALLAGIVVGATAPLIGVFIVQKGMSLVGDGLGHVAVAGIGAALLFGTSPTWTAMAFAIVAALVIEWLRARAAPPAISRSRSCSTAASPAVSCSRADRGPTPTSSRTCSARSSPRPPTTCGPCSRSAR